VSVRAKVVDDRPTVRPDGHVGIKAALHAREAEGADPGDKLAPMLIPKGVVLHAKGDLSAPLREHDVPVRTAPQERHHQRGAMPDLVHDTLADAGNVIATLEAEAGLNLRVQISERRAERLSVN
jgi:hypothetical protein